MIDSKRIGKTEKRRRGEEEKGSISTQFRVSLFPRFLFSSSLLLPLLPLLLFSLFLSACSELEKPQPEPFYAETAPPPKKEFRWSNGKMPKSFDPALAAVAPEIDVVRALYEGLTDTDPKTLAAVPAIALNWKSSEDFKTWTFNLRRDAKWSNGERITAKDFVRSWKRLSEMGAQVSHPELLRNIVGLKVPDKESIPAEADKLDILPKTLTPETLPFLSNQSNSNSAKTATKSPESNTNAAQKTKEEKPVEIPFGVEATDSFTLKISLIKSDKDFPALVAHPIFRPIYGDGTDFEKGKLNAGIITSGAFRIFSIGQDGITLDRAEHYWDTNAVELDRVRFVPAESAEKALAAYRAGEVDAITNVEFEPLALKLLMPYEDFRRTTFGAINYYEFNQQKPPFDDRRVREALTIAIERERITGDEMDGASKPAYNFLPFADDDKTKLTEDAQKAKSLLTETGFPNGENFPVVKLLVNRNNLQQRVARSVAAMWKQNLNIETEVVVKDSEQLKDAQANEDYTLVRRGAVLPTIDELTNMSAILDAENKPQTELTENKPKEPVGNFLLNRNSNSSESVTIPKQQKAESESGTPPNENESLETAVETETILTEQQAIEDFSAIPLYFPTSYSLVKPYIQGFDINSLDAPSLKDVKIDNNWQPRKTKGEL